MTFEPLALKYRPRRFEDLVGQGAPAATLRNAVVTGRVANAFLFSGSRGVGKTSMARILARALNCPDAREGEPCGTCSVCEAIARGDDLDVLEIDGASNRGIDEIRAIRDNAGYAPVRGPYKIYIIDEVHMLTPQAFNALLKTLEEPPPHVRFIFATTEPQALPETIVSRCQRYEFRRIPKPEIVGRLRSICATEGVAVDPGVLEEIAEKAEGGLRDSLGLLDHLIAFAGTKIRGTDLERVLGQVDSELLEALLLAVGTAAEGPVLDALDAIFDTGRDPEDVLIQVTEIFREAMVRSARGLPGGGEGRRSNILAVLGEHFDLDRLLLAVRLCLNARRESKLAGHGRIQLEVTFLKIARSRQLLAIPALLERLGSGVPAPASPPVSTSAARAAAPHRAPADPSTATGGPVSAARPSPPAPGGDRGAAPGARGAPAPPPAGTEPPAAAPSRRLLVEEVRELWGRVLNDLTARSARAAALLEGGRVVGITNGALAFELPPGKDFVKRQLEGALRKPIADALEAVFGQRLVLACREAVEGPGRQPSTAERSVYEDKDVRKVLDSFEGGVVAVERGDPEP